MTRAEREQLIERYLRGRMSPSEEHDFFIEVAGNKELRVDLKAYRIVDDALRKDRSADMATYSTLRAGMLTMIESRGAVLPTRQNAGKSSSGPVERTGTTPVVPAASDTGMGRWPIMLGIGAVLLVLAGGLLLRQRGVVEQHVVVRPVIAPAALQKAPVPVQSASAPAGGDAAVTPSTVTADSSSAQTDATLPAEPPAAVSTRQVRGSVHGARDRAPRRNDSTGSISGGVRAAKSDSLKIQLIIQDPKKK